MVKLNWDQSNNRWRKMVKGVAWKSSVGASKTQAVAEFETWAEQREAEIGAKTTALEIELAKLDQQAKVIAPGAALPSALDPLVTRWIDHKTGTVTPEEIKRLRTHLAKLTESIKTLDFKIDDWENLYEKIKKLDLSPKYKASLWSTFVSFFKWCTLRHQVPQFVFSGQFRWKVPQPKFEVFTKEEIKSILAASDNRLKLWILLGLNTSMTQEDLSELTWEQIDLKNKTLWRYRTKHEDKAKRRTVKYQLWQSVVDLLAELPKGKGLVFVRENGRPLVIKSTRNDLVRTELAKVTGPKKINKTFKFFRKTGATVVERLQPQFVELWLCNTPKGVSAVHYGTIEDCPQVVTDSIRNELIG